VPGSAATVAALRGALGVAGSPERGPASPRVAPVPAGDLLLLSADSPSKGTGGNTGSIHDLGPWACRMPSSPPAVSRGNRDVSPSDDDDVGCASPPGDEEHTEDDEEEASCE
ncbi:unnamed protein product, partial [Polarella glacialis]